VSVVYYVAKSLGPEGYTALWAEVAQAGCLS